MMHLLRFLAIVLVLWTAPSRAQITQATVDALIGANLPSCGDNCISASVLRSTLDTMTAAMFQAQGPAGFVLSGIPSAGNVPIASASTMGAWANLGGAILADQQAGADIGAKINAAIALLPAGGGLIDARGFLGAQTLSTAVSVPNNSKLLFGPGVIITQSATITLNTDSSLECGVSGLGTDVSGGSTLFTQANGANLPAMVLIAGSRAAIVGCALWGNGASNSTSGPNIVIQNSHYRILHTNSQGSHSHGAWIDSTGLSNQACCGTILDSWFAVNTGDGIYCTATSDTMLVVNSFEANAGSAGLELANCPGTRVTAGDFGTNVIGVWAYGTNGGLGNAEILIEGPAQFGGQAQQDILIDGTWTGSFLVDNHQIVGPSFIGGGRPDATYAVVELANMSQTGNLLSDLVIHSSGPSNRATSAIYTHGYSGSAADNISNIKANGSFSGTVYNLGPNFASNVCAITSCLPNVSFANGGGVTAGFQVVATFPFYAWEQPSQGTDGKWWDCGVINATFNCRTLNDAQSVQVDWLTVTRSGNTIASVAFPSTAPVNLSGTLGIPQATWTDTQACNAGQISVDASFIYVCTASNTVKRAALSSF